MRKHKHVCIVASTLMLVSVSVFAHGGATGIVKERMDFMGSLGKAMKQLTAMMRGKTEYNEDEVRKIAVKIQNHGGDAMTKLFPKDSIDGPSEALPNIWQKWDQFEAYASRLKTYGLALEMAAGNDRGGPSRGGMTSGQGMMGTNMMGQGMMSQGGGMMMGAGQGPTAKMLKTMPPDASFMHIAQTCSSCHQDFRKPK
mgnify:CR=1 FL=1